MSDAKTKDPSEINNSINGFDILPCTGMIEGTIVVVIPNLGYGMLATTCARRGYNNKEVTPSSMLSFNINGLELGPTGETIGVDNTEAKKDSITVTISGSEIFAPLNGYKPEMFSTVFKVNSMCDSGAATINNMILPLPFKVKPTGGSSYIEEMKQASYIHSIQALLLRAAHEISKNAQSTTEEKLLIEGVSSVSMRSASYTVNTDKKNQWTSPGYTDNTRIEAIELYSDASTYLPDMISSGINIEGHNNIFVRPFVAIYTEGSTDKKRLYYSKRLDDIIARNMTIKGVDLPPIVTLDRNFYLLDKQGSIQDPAWGTSIDKDEATELIGLDITDLDVLASTSTRRSYMMSNDVIHPIETVIRYNYSTLSDEEQTIRLHTLRPPLLTNGDYVIHNDKTYILPFAKAYMLPIASGEGVITNIVKCRYCGGTGKDENTKCLNCISNPGWIQCPTCKGAASDIEYRDISDGYIYIENPIDGSIEQNNCPTCNPWKGHDNYVEGNEYKLGYIPCPDCNGTGVWEPIDCTACNGNKICGEVPAPEAKRVRKFHPHAVHVNANQSVITVTVNKDEVGFTPAKVTLFIDYKLLKKEVTSPNGMVYQTYEMTSESSANTVSYTFNLLKGENYTVTTEDRRKTFMISDIHSDTFTDGDIWAYAIEVAPAAIPYGFIWDEDPNVLPTLDFKALPENDLNELIKLTYINPDQADSFDDVEAENYRKNFPEREGFSTLGYMIDQYLGILSSIKSNLEDLSCSPIAIKAEMGDFKGNRVSNGSPFDEFVEFMKLEDVPGKYGSFDGLMLGPLREDESTLKGPLGPAHTDRLGIKTPYDDSFVYTSLEELLKDISLALSVYSTDEEKVFQYLIYTSAGKIRQSADASPMVADTPISIPYGEGISTSEITDPINKSSVIQCNDDGEFNLSLLLGNSKSSDDNENLKTAMKLIDTIPNLCAKVMNALTECTVKITDIGGGYNIVSPDPLFNAIPEPAIFSAEVEVSRKGYLQNIFDILTHGSIKSDYDYINNHHDTFSVAYQNLTNAIESNDSNISNSVIDILSVLGEVSYILFGLQNPLTLHSEAESRTEIYTEIFQSTPPVTMTLYLPDDDGFGHPWTNKGLWFYNIRKSYLLITAMVNVITAVVQKSYNLLAAHKYAFKVMPVEEEGAEVELNVALYKGIGGSRNCYPTLPKEVDIDVSEVRVNDISRFLKEESMYYDVTFRIPQALTLSSEDTTPVIMTGMGINYVKYPDMGINNSLYWLIKSDATAIKDLIASKDDEGFIYMDNGYFYGIQEFFSSKDFVAVAGETVKYIDYNADAVETAPYSDVPTLWSQLASGNRPDDSIFIQAKPEIKSKIDVGYVFPYISSVTTNTSYSGNLSLTFASAQPQVITLEIDERVDIIALKAVKSKLNSSLNLKSPDIGREVSSVKKEACRLASRLSSSLTFAPLMEANKVGNGLNNVKMNIPFIGTADPVLVLGSRGESDIMRIALHKVFGKDMLSFKYTDNSDMSKWKDKVLGLDKQWRTGTLSGYNTNYNLHLSFRRAILVSKIVIKMLVELLPDPKEEFKFTGSDRTFSGPDDAKIKAEILGTTGNEFEYNGDKYKTWIHLHDADNILPSVVQTAIKANYAAVPNIDPNSIVCFNPFACYGFGALFANAKKSGTPEVRKSMRTTALSYSNPSSTGSLPNIEILNPKGDIGNSNINGSVPAGKERYILETPATIINKNFDSLYFPSMKDENATNLSITQTEAADDVTRVVAHWNAYIKIYGFKAHPKTKEKLISSNQQEIQEAIEGFINLNFKEENKADNIFRPSDSLSRVWIVAAKIV